MASVLSFLALNFFFTPPFHTFTVAKIENLVALAVFLAVSATVGTMLSRVLTQRARAERRERETRLLHHLGTRLLTGVPTDEVLRSLARSVTDLFGLARCEITTELAEEPIVVESNSEQSSGGPSETIPMVAKDREVGRIVAVPDGAHSSLGPDERSVIQTFASQMALAIEGMRLASEAQQARVESETTRETQAGTVPTGTSPISRSSALADPGGSHRVTSRLRRPVGQASGDEEGREPGAGIGDRISVARLIA